LYSKLLYSNINPILKRRILRLLRLTDVPVVKVYNSFGDARHYFVIGHVFRITPLPRKRYRNFFLINALALIRLFFMRPKAKAKVVLRWQGQVVETVTDTDGFFRLDWSCDTPASPGWHPVEVTLQEATNRDCPCTGRGRMFIPYETATAIISDIDDTFLISHSSTIWRRLSVLLTKNPRSRKAFEGVIEHYKLLEYAGTKQGAPNSFFFVSSSEWNLYDYIQEFSRVNEVPDGVYLLSQLKAWYQLFLTGRNNHSTKFTRISRILLAHPQQQFVLLGDDSQEDPNIYASVVSHFPSQIRAVYLRHVSDKKTVNAVAQVEQMRAAGVACCYFENSSEAIAHSRQIGLIV
jgi:phosphatidate phosphatase APP1